MADESFKPNGNKPRYKKKDGLPDPEPESLGNYGVPRSLEAERGVLGAMLLDNEIINPVMEAVKADEFFLTAHKIIYETILELHDRGKPVDLTLLVEALRQKKLLEEAGGLSGLAALEMQIFSTGAAPEWAQTISEKATMRALMRAAEKIMKDAAEEVRDAKMQIDDAERMIFDIGQKKAVNEFIHIRDLMSDAIQHIGDLKSRTTDVTGTPTHFTDLDEYLNGLHGGDLLILAARPSMGKTAFALNLMLNIATESNVPVGIFSLEMGRMSLVNRLLACYARISGKLLSTGHLKDKEYEIIRLRGKDMSESDILIDDTPAGMSIMQLRSKARRMKSQYPNLGLIVVDYLQLMTAGTSRGRDNRQQEVSDISRGLKALARELNTPVMALSQLSRNVEQRSGKDKASRPMLSDLRESGAIEQDADVVMFVHRERKETEKDADGKLTHKGKPIPTEIIIGKHRNGPIGIVNLQFWADQTRFTNAASE